MFMFAVAVETFCTFLHTCGCCPRSECDLLSRYRPSVGERYVQEDIERCRGEEQGSHFCCVAVVLRDGCARARVEISLS